MIWNQINVNAVAASIMTRMVLPDMEARGRGAIVNLSSLAGSCPHPMVEVYAATKSYVNFLSIGLNQQYARKGKLKLAW